VNQVLRFINKTGLMKALAGSPLMKWVGQRFLENDEPLEALSVRLENSGRSVQQRFLEAGESEFSKKLLAHIITIERWGISRLQMLLGDKPVVLDSSHNFAPSGTRTFAELQQDFAQTRQALLVLVPRLEQNHNTIEHNAFGNLSGKGWLKYLAIHASRESKKL
jgi:hypothetical protein